ncbi:hypothetical protein [Sulfolobus acidocaldarius]|uniref:Conserved Archaeal protein n=4 Tax=Sulfolobus acidocaldarius TaxID=2285 RepID=Q4J7E8_SULAC|nr:hypothetical protein [Sulfolobus acidocaldarius]AAY81282.1 conserved Archaeal protein [Sulfolobus acidocaldarius DSM 639]AGE71916.1 hypothetical protein SacN8_09795 [Sulfolobus acidocaldarius N8]AGE74189.1 hypothetical protein SacRon12I_09820 [Sulfolobus acidocaldarius Ron12/I]ALU29914.1 CopG family transcriptional regulator [Sulfolobus acidocaldarius]ALU32656.1 CopG family transcriptional regulator [Sulfolobus acidocaldarius]
MSEVVSFKVKREIKQKMELYRTEVNWSEELRGFVEQKIAEIEAKKGVNKILQELKDADWGFQKGISSQLTREDRDADS